MAAAGVPIDSKNSGMRFQRPALEQMRHDLSAGQINERFRHKGDVILLGDTEIHVHVGPEAEFVIKQVHLFENLAPRHAGSPDGAFHFGVGERESFKKILSRHEGRVNIGQAASDAVGFQMAIDVKHKTRGWIPQQSGAPLFDKGGVVNVAVVRDGYEFTVCAPDAFV